VEETKRKREREKNRETNEQSIRDRKLHIRPGVTEENSRSSCDSSFVE